MVRTGASLAKVLIEKKNDRVRKGRLCKRLLSGRDTGTVPDRGRGNGGKRWRKLKQGYREFILLSHK